MKKNDLRKEFLGKRQELSEKTTEELSRKIGEMLFTRLPVHRYGIIHTFLPIAGNREVDTFQIISRLRKDFPAEIYVPSVRPDGQLSHHLLTADTILKKNRWGIPEPDNLPDEGFMRKAAEENMLVLVPLLAFDKTGHRVGYGKGFYDRFLATCPGNTLIAGLSFFDPVDRIDDADSHDITMNHVITPDKVWSFSE